MRSQALRSAAIRVGALRLLLLAVFAVLAARAGQLAVLGASARQHGDRQIHTRIALPSARGLILDRAGRELAISIDAPSVYVLPELLADRSATAHGLARILSRTMRLSGAEALAAIANIFVGLIESGVVIPSHLGAL